MLDTTLMNSLADYWSEEGNGVSFYFSEAQPQNRAHSTGVITAKELAHNVGRKDSSPELRNIIERLEQKANELRTSSAGLAIFAGPSDFWEEIELPYSVQPQASIGNSFILTPLLPLLTSRPNKFILLLDRSVTRLLHIHGDETIDEVELIEEGRQKVRETGTSRKVSDERSKDDDTYHHLREVGERIRILLQHEMADGIYVGCRKELWAEIQAAMPEMVVRSVLGQFSCDPGLLSIQEVIELMKPMTEEKRKEHLHKIIEDAVGGAVRNARGAVGAREVIRAIEQGEAQTIVIGPHMPVAASLCTACSHIDIGRPSTCSLCGRPVYRFNDLSEIVVRRARKEAFTVQMAGTKERFPEKEGFIAKLRFRADRSTAQVA